MLLRTVVVVSTLVACATHVEPSGPDAASPGSPGSTGSQCGELGCDEPPDQPPDSVPPGTPPPDEIDVQLFFIGDCVTASCPADYPYPVGCDVAFSPGDDRGCVASTPTSATVYFQAGDECDKGVVGGTLRCANTPGSALDATSCTINKPVPIYATSPGGCPAVH